MATARSAWKSTVSLTLQYWPWTFSTRSGASLRTLTRCILSLACWMRAMLRTARRLPNLCALSSVSTTPWLAAGVRLPVGLLHPQGSGQIEALARQTPGGTGARTPSHPDCRTARGGQPDSGAHAGASWRDVSWRVRSPQRKSSCRRTFIPAKPLPKQRATRRLTNNALLSRHLCRQDFCLVEERKKRAQVIEIVLPLPAGRLLPRVPLSPQFHIFIHIREEVR